MKKFIILALQLFLLFKAFSQSQDIITLPYEKTVQSEYRTERFSFGTHWFIQSAGNKYGNYIKNEQGLSFGFQYGIPSLFNNKEVGVSANFEIGQIIPVGKWNIEPGTLIALYGGLWISLPINDNWFIEPEIDYGFNHRGLQINGKKNSFNDQLFRFALNLNYYPPVNDGTANLFCVPYIQVVPFKNNPTFFIGVKLGVTYNFNGMIQSNQKMKNQKKLEDDLNSLNISDITIRSSKEGLIIGMENIQFKPNSAELMETEKQKIEKVSELLSTFRNKLLVIGYCAETGDDDNNLRISAERAGVVGDYLVKLKVRAPEDITVIGRGALNPLASNDTDTGRSNNRRVEITVLDN